MGYTTPTPIQSKAIPVVMQGGDVMGAAQTGTGKTAGFALPIIQRLLPGANTSMSPGAPPGACAGADADARTGRPGGRQRQALYRRHAAALCRHLWRHRHGSADAGAANRRRDRRRDARATARPSADEEHLARAGAGGRARRGRSNARYGLFARYLPHPEPAAERAAEPDVLGDVFRGDQEARRQLPARPGADRGRAAQCDRRKRDPGSRAAARIGKDRRAARTAAHAWRGRRTPAAGTGVRQLEDRVPTAGASAAESRRQRRCDPRRQDTGRAHEGARGLQERLDRGPGRH